MAFEELPAEYEAFFKSGGELPASLLEQHAGTPAPAPAPTPTAAPTAAPAPSPAPATIPDAPAVPTSNPYLERLLAEKDQQVANLAQQMKDLQAQIARANEIPAPDPTIDPLGAMTHSLAALQKQLADMQAAQADVQKQTQTQTQAQQFFGMVNQQVNAFKATHEDYDAAYKHLVDTRSQDFKDLGMTDAQVRQAIGNEEMQITQNAIAQGKNPAELVYNFAKRYGYQAKAPTPTPENKLETIRKGIDASATLDRSTPPEAGSITIDNISAASEADIDKMVANNWEGIFGVKKGVV